MSVEYGLVVVGLLLAPGLVLAAIGRLRPTHPATLMALFYLSAAALQLVPGEVHRARPPLLVAVYVATDAALLASLAWFRHRVTWPAARASVSWLVANYGVAAAMCGLAATFPLLIPRPTFADQLFVYRVVFLVYYATMAGLILRALVRTSPAAERRGTPLFAVGVGLFPVGAILLAIARGDALFPALQAAVGLTFAAPFAGPRMARVVHTALVGVALTAAARIGYSTFEAVGPLAAGGHALSDVSRAQLVAAALYALPALVLAICARQDWTTLRARRLPTVLPRLVPVFEGVIMLASALMALLWLCPAELKSAPPGWFFAMMVLQHWCVLGGAAVVVHAVRLAAGAAPPGAAWLLANYGSAAMVALGSFLFLVVPGPPAGPRVVAYLATQQVYIAIAMLIVLRHLARAARGNGWRRPSTEFTAGRADVVLTVSALAGMVVWGLVIFSTPPNWQPTPAKLAAIVLTSWVAAIPGAVRNLGAVVRGMLVAGVALGVAAAVHVGARAFAAPLAAAGLGRLGTLATVLALVTALVPGSSWTRQAVDRVIFRRSHRRRAEIQRFMHSLSPESGAADCCRRVLDRLVAVMPCRGAAILLSSGEAAAAGGLPLEPLRRVWPADTDGPGLPGRTLVGWEIGELPATLRQGLREARATGIVPIESPGRRWGHLVFRLGLLDSAFRDEDVQAIEAVADQLALVLDGTELLARARHVERSLAHAEKLAALGELAARIAHEIRNPLTAARSLAQQLQRERRAGDDDAAPLILAELERVERQVAALLRFARREEFRFEPVDLGGLVRTTLETYRSRVEIAGVDLDVDLADGVVVRADPERLRQALVNLIENALDALGDVVGPRRLGLHVRAENGSGALRVRDTGPGVPPDRLPHLFEPFFTTKTNGTGLGLAITKRVIDAHGGRLLAEVPADGGAVFIVQLPTVRVMEPPRWPSAS